MLTLSRTVAVMLTVAGSALATAQTLPGSRLRLRDQTLPQLGAVRTGTFTVFEDRDARQGRTIDLRILVLRAKAAAPAEDPVFYLAGGPGQAATSLARSLATSWMRDDRDIVLVDQRGTGGSNELQVRLRADDSTPQSLLTPLFDVEAFRASIPKLQAHADLRLYTTPIAMDDLDDVRVALGYTRVNLVGGSYGTRAALVYMRRHEASVRCAILTGVAPPSLLNPLYHARGAQAAFDALAAECEAEPRYRTAFGDLRARLATIVGRLEAAPADVVVVSDGGEVHVQLTRDAFAEALRVMLYYLGGNRRVPLLVDQAFRGDYREFARIAIESNGGLRRSLAFGMLMSVVGSEDLPRIEPDMIEPATAGTFLGARRVRDQLAVGEFWPRGEIGEEYAAPLTVRTPTLLISGTMDPVTPPGFAAELHEHLGDSVHVVVPGAHEGKDTGCVGAIQRRFLSTARTEGLDLRCVASVRLPPLVMPAPAIR